jgi:hypothetical protein
MFYVCETNLIQQPYKLDILNLTLQMQQFK